VVSLDGHPAPTRPDQLPGLDTATTEADLGRLDHYLNLTVKAVMLEILGA